MTETVPPRAALPSAAQLRDRRTAADLVADALREAIRCGELQDGVELNQVQLAEHFGLSRVPVREALRALEAEGWIVARAHRRAVVQTLSSERIAQIFDMRTLLEGYVVERAAERCTAEQIAGLSEHCAAMDATTDHGTWLASNRAFHAALHACAGAELAQQMIEQLTGQVERYLRLRGEDVVREDEANVEHRAIVAALARRDRAAARALVETHIDHTRRRVLAAIGERDRLSSTEAEMENR